MQRLFDIAGLSTRSDFRLFSTTKKTPETIDQVLPSGSARAAALSRCYSLEPLLCRAGRATWCFLNPIQYRLWQAGQCCLRLPLTEMKLRKDLGRGHSVPVSQFSQLVDGCEVVPVNGEPTSVKVHEFSSFLKTHGDERSIRRARSRCVSSARRKPRATKPKGRDGPVPVP